MLIWSSESDPIGRSMQAVSQNIFGTTKVISEELKPLLQTSFEKVFQRMRAKNKAKQKNPNKLLCVFSPKGRFFLSSLSRF